MVSRSRKCLPWIEVLCRLSVKSILRCRSVCRTWHRIIVSDFFVKTHLEHQKTSSNTNKYILHDQSQSYTLLTDYESIFYRTRSSCSKLFYSPELFGFDFPQGVRIYAICDGLLCVSDEGYSIGDNIYLWNPICRKAKKLPKLEFSINADLAYGGLCFGYYDNDYKVIVIYPVNHTYIVSVYSLSTNCWKIIDTNFYSEDETEGCTLDEPTKFIDGTAYMITAYRPRLVCFNLRAATIRQLEFPEEFVEHAFKITMEAYGETIAVLGSCRCNSRYMYLWMLRDKSSSNSPWEKKLVIELQETGLTFTHGVGFLGNGKYLIRSTMVFGEDSGLTKFFLSDLESPKLTEFRCHDGLPDCNHDRIDSNCVESLLLLDENSLDPFVRTDIESSCSSTLFTLYNSHGDIPAQLQLGKNV